MGLTTTLRWATRDPVPGPRVFDVLRAWGLGLDQHTSFCHWRWMGSPPRTNPLRQQMSRVRELDQELGLTLERAAPIRVWLDLGPPPQTPRGPALDGTALLCWGLFLAPLARPRPEGAAFVSPPHADDHRALKGRSSSGAESS